MYKCIININHYLSKTIFIIKSKQRETQHSLNKITTSTAILSVKHFPRNILRQNKIQKKSESRKLADNPSDAIDSGQWLSEKEHL